MNDEPRLVIHVVPPPDDDLDAACEAVVAGRRSFVLEQVPDDDPLTMRFRLSPEECGARA